MIKHKIIGLIGGHGYNATIYLQEAINKEIINTKNTRQYINSFIINDALINNDNVKYNVLYENIEDNKNIEKDFFKIYEILIKYGCNVITLPCNTYSYLLSNNRYIKQNDNIKILNIIDETSKFINNNFKNINNIGLLATSQTINSNLYQKNINKNIITYDELTDDINTIILLSQFGYYEKRPTKEILKKIGINKEINLVKIMNNILNKFTQNNIYHIILGCTELPLFVNYNKQLLLKNIKYIDTIDILAKSIISC